MKATKPEFSRPLAVDRVPRKGSTEKIAADAKELKALAARMKLPAIHAFRAEFRATPWRGGGLKLEGGLTADLEQISVISLEAFRQSIEIQIERFFLPPGAVSESEDDDADPIEKGSVDLGEVAAEALALDLDPYPKRPGEEFSAHVEAIEAAPGEPSPFAPLAGRKPG